MRLICGVAGTVVAAVLAVSAHAVDLPPVPVPTLPIPTLPTPTLPTPTVPAPPVPAPTVPTPTVPTPPITAPGVTTPPAPVPTPQPQPQPTTPAAAPPTAATSSRPAGAAAAPRRTAGAHHAKRAAVYGHVRLDRAGRIVVSVRELAPVCRTLGHYALAGRKGANPLRLPARVKKAGSYSFVGRARGRTVFSIEARVARGRRIVPGATTSVCPRPLISVLSAQTAPQLHVKDARARRTAVKAIASSRGSSSPLVSAVSLSDAPASVRPLLFALLALAILFLATAAAPQRLLPAGRAAAVIAHQRLSLAAAGILLLFVVAVVTAFA